MKLPFIGKSDEEDGPPPAEMTLIDHLKELRRRLIWSVAAIIVGGIVSWIFRFAIFDFLQAPYCDFQESVGKECEFGQFDLLSGFSTMITIAGYGGLIFATPVILYHAGRFVLPGLYPNEKKALLPFVAISIVLLALGMATAYLVMPKAIDVLLNEFSFDTFEPLLDPQRYLGFFIKMLFAFGIASELPLVLVFLQKIGVVRNETLAKNRRIAIVAVVILGAVITPTGDPFMLGVISIPMYVFYEISILIGKRMQGPPRPADEPVGAGHPG